MDPAHSFPEYYPACTSVAQLGSRADWVRLLSQLTHGPSNTIILVRAKHRFYSEQRYYTYVSNIILIFFTIVLHYVYLRSF